jgi:hypothetical protein
VAASDDLLALLRIDSGDLAANRAGHLGPGQTRGSRSAAKRWAVAGVVLGAFFVSGAQASTDALANWLIPLVVGVVLCAGCFVVAYAQWTGDDAPVRCLTGPVDIRPVGQGRAGYVLKLFVDGQQCSLPRRVLSTDKRWHAAVGDGEYHVYVTGRSASRVVGLEPVG